MAKSENQYAVTKASRSQRVAIAVLRAPITLYRWFVSPFLPATCRHVPSCSTYAQEAIMRHGAWRGGWLTVSRLARCHPLGSHGLDPVPDVLPGPYDLLNAWRYGRWTGRHITHRFHEGNDRRLHKSGE